MPFHSLFWFLAVSLSGWFVFLKAVAASTRFVFSVVLQFQKLFSISSGVVFRSARSFEGCCGFHWLRFQGGLQLQKLLSVSSGAVLRAARCFKYCFSFIVFGFWAVAFSALVVTLPPTMHYKGPGKGAEFWIAVSLLTFFVQQPLPQPSARPLNFSVGG